MPAKGCYNPVHSKKEIQCRQLTCLCSAWGFILPIGNLICSIRPVVRLSFLTHQMGIIQQSWTCRFGFEKQHDKGLYGECFLTLIYRTQLFKMADHSEKTPLQPRPSCCNFFMKSSAGICDYVQWPTVCFGLLKRHCNKPEEMFLQYSQVKKQMPRDYHQYLVKQIWTTSTVFFSNSRNLGFSW